MNEQYELTGDRRDVFTWKPKPEAVAAIKDFNMIHGNYSTCPEWLALKQAMVKAVTLALHHGCVGGQIEAILLEVVEKAAEIQERE